jgi:hypothetical protein
LSETLSQQGQPTLTESVTLSDSSLFSGQAQIIDIVQLSDNLALLGLMQESAESVQLSDGAVAFLVINRLVLPSESVTVSDILSAMQGLTTITDAASLSETLALQGSSIMASESVTLTDLLSLLGIAQAMDAVSLSDAVVALLGYEHVALKATTPSGTFNIILPSGAFKVSRPS